MRCRLLPVWFLSLLPVIAGGADWPAWRGPAGTGVSAETGLPVHWSLSSNVLWKTPLAGAGVSAPVVWGDRVFVTASDGRLNDRLHVYCLHADDGRTLWHARLFGSAQPEGLFPPGGMAVPTPATDGKALYALFGTGDLVCVDFAGKPLWIRSLAEEYGPFRNRWGMGSSPVLLGDLLIVQVDHWSQSYLLGVDAGTGANRWRTLRDASVNWSSPVVVVQSQKGSDPRKRQRGQTPFGPQIVVTGTYRVQGYDPADGKELWSVRGLEMQCIPSPVVQDGLAYAVSGRDGYCFAVRLDGTRGDVTSSHVLWKRKKPKMPYITSPVCTAGLCFLVEDSLGMGTCLDAHTGAELWHQRLGGTYHASPVAGDGKVYFPSMDGVVAVVEAGPKFKLLARNKLEEPIVASPAIAHRRLYIRGEKHLFCIAENQN
jgi:outer membrane protein assembly factor BamB